MKNRDWSQAGSTAIALGVLVILLFRFGRYIQGFSYDLAQHFLLVDEIMKYATVLPGDIPQMSTYPPGAHWLAALVGWIGGSGLVGITLASIASVYFSYLLIVRLVGDSAIRLLVFAIAFMALRPAMSLIGWEVVRNYFYSQLVTDVIYLGVLLWMAHNPSRWIVVAGLLAVGWFGMWVHPLIPLHLLATGCVLMTFTFLLERNDKDGRRSAAASVLVLVAGSAVIVAKNPALKDMAQLALNDGWLVFGYSHITPMAMLCAIPGVCNLYRRWKGRAEHVDAVLGSAVIAGACLVFIQLAALRFLHDGSAYAVKKHMFIVFTLGVLNMVRALPAGKLKVNARLATPILAGFASIIILQGFDTPVEPIVRALAYADNAVSYQLPNFRRGDFVADIDGLPRMGNWMVTMGPFGHEYDARSISWQSGTSIKDGARYVMVRRADAVECSENIAGTQDYAIVDPACLH
jgi:hypothetical protein